MASQFSRHGRLFRYPDSGFVGGVCAGFAEYLGWSVRLIRVLAVLTLIFSGIFPIVLIYAACWYLMPRQPGRPIDRDDDRPRSTRSADSAPSGGPVYRQDVQTRFSRLEQRLGRMEECVTTGDYELRRELRKLET